MARKVLTDRALNALKPAAAGKRYEVMDGVVPGFGVRVTDKRKRTFILIARYAGADNPTRRALGEYGAITLETAREKARDWIKMIQRGIDPKVVEEQQLREAARARKNSVAAVAEDFIREKVLGPKFYDEWSSLEWKTIPQGRPLERKGLEVTRDIRREIIPRWGKLPITELARPEIRLVVEAKAQSAPAQARNLLGIIKRMFSWAIDKERYGLALSPADTLRPTKIFGKKKTRNRILDDVELFALWRAAKRMPYPQGSVYQLLTLNALRLNEAADAAKPEFDFAKKLWTIPEDRMKGDDADARAHVVPLTDDTMALLASLPKFRTGHFVFSTTFGKSPVWIGNKVKRRLDRQMLLTLRALARLRGDDPKKVTLKHWVNHDIRRTVRSNLSALRVSEEVREAVLAHARPGIKQTYDLHDYVDEKREALELWAARLRAIVEPPPANVVSIATARG